MSIKRCISLLFGLIFVLFSARAEEKSPRKATEIPVDITGINVLCENETRTTTLTVVIPSDSTHYKPVWNTGSTERSIEVTIPVDSSQSTFYATIYDDNFEDSIIGVVSRTVYVTTLPTPATRVTDTVCSGENREVIVGMTGTTARHFLWTWDTAHNGFIDTVNHWSPPPSGDLINFWIPPFVYRMRLNVQMSMYPIMPPFENACYISDSTFVEIDDARFYTSNDTAVCQESSITLHVMDAVDTIAWSNGDTNVTSITVNLPEHGVDTFWVETYDYRGCKAHKEILVTVLPKPSGVAIEMDYIQVEGVTLDSGNICRGSSAVLTAVCESDCGSFVWQPTREITQSIDVLPRERFTYTVKAFGNTDRTGCSSTAEITIGVQNCDVVYFPNAIRLSSQKSENRIFRPLGLPREFSKYYFAVFDRWGQMIFESNDFYVGWDGTHQGQNVRPGTYVYKFRLTNKLDVWEKIGTVTVID